MHEKRNKEVLKLLPMINRLVYKNTNNNKSDMVNEAVVAVIDAYNNYQDKNPDLWESYAYFKIKSTILEFIKSDRCIPNSSKSIHNKTLAFEPIPKSHLEIRALAEKKGVTYSTALKYALGQLESFDEHRCSGLGDVVFNQALDAEIGERLIQAFSRIKERDRNMFLAHADGLKNPQIAEAYGITHQRVQQILTKTKQTLASSLKGVSL